MLSERYHFVHDTPLKNGTQPINHKKRGALWSDCFIKLLVVIE